MSESYWKSVYADESKPLTLADLNAAIAEVEAMPRKRAARMKADWEEHVVSLPEGPERDAAVARWQMSWFI